MSTVNHIRYEITDSIGVVTLCDPPGNVLPVPAFIGDDLMDRITTDPELKGLIIKGEGRNFSAGGNLERIFVESSDQEALRSLMDDGHRTLSRITSLDIPVIAAINRVCFGGGLEIALACHIRVASENALLAFPETNQNLMPGMGGTVRLPALAGFAVSARMILEGDTLSATEARELGLVDHIAPRDGAFRYAFELMLKMTQDRPVTVIRSVMRALHNAEALPPADALREETRMFCALASTEADRRRKEGE